VVLARCGDDVDGGGHGRDGAVEDAPDGVGVAEVPQVVVAGGVAGALADRLAEACRAG
jgi:hypothetical protein